MLRRTVLILGACLLLAACSHASTPETTPTPTTVPTPPDQLIEVVQTPAFEKSVSESLFPHVEASDVEVDPYDGGDVPTDATQHFQTERGAVRFEEGAAAAGEVVAVLAKRLEKWFALLEQEFEPFGGIEILSEPARDPVAVDDETFVLDGRWRTSAWQYWRGDIWGIHVRPAGDTVEVVDYILSGWPTDAYAYRASELVGDPQEVELTLGGEKVGYVEAIWLSAPWDRPSFLKEMSLGAGEWRMYAMYCITEPWLEVNPESLYSETRGWGTVLAATYGVGVWTPSCYMMTVHHLTETDLNVDAVIEIPVRGESVGEDATVELSVPAFGVPENLCALGRKEGTLLCPEWGGEGSLDENPTWSRP